MENLNAEKIINEIQSLIKALKNCGGWVKRGNDEGWFNHEILADALAILKLQEQRIKELTEENDKLHASCTELARVQEENEKLKRICESYALQYGTATDKEVFLKKERADTVRKMQQRIKEYFPYDADSGLYVVLDQIANEMLEGE